MKLTTARDARSPFRDHLENAALRLEDLAKRSSPMVAAMIRREVVVIREASIIVEGNACNVCDGSGTVIRGSAHHVTTGKCHNCGGTGDL